jgi:hypothetical protein
MMKLLGAVTCPNFSTECTKVWSHFQCCAIVCTSSKSQFSGYNVYTHFCNYVFIRQVHISVKGINNLKLQKTLITNKCRKSFSSIVTHSYMTHTHDPAGSSSGRTFSYRYTKVTLHSWARMCCWLRTALFLEAWTLCGRSRSRFPRVL